VEVLEYKNSSSLMTEWRTNTIGRTQFLHLALFHKKGKPPVLMKSNSFAFSNQYIVAPKNPADRVNLARIAKQEEDAKRVAATNIGSSTRSSPPRNHTARNNVTSIFASAPSASFLAMNPAQPMSASVSVSANAALDSVTPSVETAEVMVVEPVVVVVVEPGVVAVVEPDVVTVVEPDVVTVVANPVVSVTAFTVAAPVDENRTTGVVINQNDFGIFDEDDSAQIVHTRDPRLDQARSSFLKSCAAFLEAELENVHVLTSSQRTAAWFVARQSFTSTSYPEIFFGKTR